MKIGPRILPDPPGPSRTLPDPPGLSRTLADAPGHSGTLPDPPGFSRMLYAMHACIVPLWVDHKTY